MSDKVFIDTNVFVYLQSITEPEKAAVAKKIVNSKSDNHISTQVLNELASALLRKYSLTPTAVADVIKGVSSSFILHTITYSTILKALSVVDRYQISYYDALIVASALEAGCTTLFTEDMADGQIINTQLTIRNPFKA